MSETLPQLANGAWLFGLALLPILAFVHHRWQGFGSLTYSRLPTRSGGSFWTGVRLHLPFYARLLGLGCLLVAMARPQLGYAWEESLTEGIDIELALDVSGSMAAEDFQPHNRVSVAKQVVKEFVAGRTSDRIGLIVFAGTAMNRSPLTTDHAALDQLIEAVDVNALPDGTAIGVALATAAARLRTSPAKSRVVVLVTDGVNNAGEIDPLSAATLCRGLGIRVYTVGVGTNGRVPVPFPVRNPLTGEREIRRVMMNVSVDHQLLREIAQRTHGQSFAATDRQGLREIFRSIDRLEKTALKVKRYVRYREVFPPLAWSGLALLLFPLATAGLKATAEP
jgi:Ca-activated chloride channel family protein